jgi:hypothetical protein
MKKEFIRAFFRFMDEVAAGWKETAGFHRGPGMRDGEESGEKSFFSFGDDFCS